MPEQPLPANWTEEVDAKGRRFYSNHIAQKTQWERPAPDEPSFPRERPPPYRSTVPQVQQVTQSRASQDTANYEWTPRVTFWSSAALALPVWIFSVSAAGDDKWLEDVPFSAFDEDILGQCADDYIRTETHDFCDIYVSFMVMQLIATMLASVALAQLSMALFFPAADSRWSAKVLGTYGAYAVAASVFFQLVVLVLILVITESDAAYFFDDTDTYNGLGSTYWVAMVGFALALFDARFLLKYVNSTGDGLFYECIGKLVTSER